jgi:hypothetical protein
MTRRLPALLLAFLAVLLGGPRSGLGGGTKDPGVPDPAFQKEIDAAVKKGAVWLRSQQQDSGSFGGIATNQGVHFEIGTTALVALALLAAGDTPGDKAVDAALAFAKGKDDLRSSTGARTTYDTGVLLMFLTEYHLAAKGKHHGRGGGRGAKGAESACNLPEDAKRWVQSLADSLVNSRQEAKGYLWGYPQYDVDLSNTQYAFLGLRAARDCGAAVPPALFEQAIRSMLARQEPDGPKVKRTIPATGPGEAPYAVDAGDRARGWRYHPEPFPVTGSMTTAAIAVLAISHDALTRPERSSLYDEKLERDLSRSVQDGFSWLDQNWSVDKNPGNGAPDWHLYYLYGLERAGTFGGRGRDLIGPHDWYLEGAHKLVGMQKDDGRWSTGQMGDGKDYRANDFCETAWAILFLKRATRPFPPIRAPAITPGG